MSDLISREELKKAFSTDMRITNFDGTRMGAGGYLVERYKVVGLINAAPAVDDVPRWIPVEERMPEHGKNVLVHVANRVGMWHTEIDWQKENGEWANNADCEWNTVTHWMHLQEPPEEGAN